MGQNATKKPKVRKQAKRELSVRQAQVLTYLALGKRVREIAQKLGVSDDSIRRDIRRLEETRTYDNRLEVELEKHCLLWNKAYACIEGNLDHGNLRAAEDILRYTGVWLDRLEVTGKIDSNKQQKKMMENMETLLKLSRDQVKGALPEKIEGVGVVCNHPSDISGPDGCPKCATILTEMTKESKRVEAEVTKETETQSQLEKPNKDHKPETAPHDLIEHRLEDRAKNEAMEMPKETETETQSQRGAEMQEMRDIKVEATALVLGEKVAQQGKGDSGVPDHIQKIPGVVMSPETCTCEPGWVGDISHPVNGKDPKCPVHGDKDKEQAVFTNPKSPRYGQIVDLPSGDDEDKDQGAHRDFIRRFGKDS